MKSTFSVIYYLKRQIMKKDGTVPIIGHITVDSSQTQFSCKLAVDPKLWDAKGERVTSRGAAALETSRVLDKIRVRINRRYQGVMERDDFVTAEKVKNAFLGLEHRYYTLVQVYRRYNEDYEEQVEAGMKAEGTLEKYRIVYKHLQEFLGIRYHVKDIILRELTPVFISDFEMFLHTDKHCYANTVRLYICPLRTMMFIAINNGQLARDPLREYEIKREETAYSFLTKEEVRLLINGKLKNAKQELYRGLYLFYALTGLSFSDMHNLTEENIRTYFDEHEWINTSRRKTGVVSNVRLLDIANRIIDKCRGLCEDGKMFPVPHYNTYLTGIHAVAKRYGITKHITWHQSRRTAAMMVFLSSGIPIETVSSALGHKSIKTTQIYAKITKEKLNQGMKNLAARLSSVEESAGYAIQKREAMKRDIVIVEDKAVSITDNDVWMTAAEIVGLFHTTVPVVNTAVKTIRKLNVLNDYEVCHYMQLENGLYADVYALEITIPVTFRLNTYNTHLFRTWLVGEALAKEKRQAYMMFIQSGKTGCC